MIIPWQYFISHSIGCRTQFTFGIITKPSKTYIVTDIKAGLQINSGQRAPSANKATTESVGQSQRGFEVSV